MHAWRVCHVYACRHVCMMYGAPYVMYVMYVCMHVMSSDTDTDTYMYLISDIDLYFSKTFQLSLVTCHYLLRVLVTFN